MSVAGCGTPLASLREAGGSVWEEGNLRVSAETTAHATLSQINRRCSVQVLVPAHCTGSTVFLYLQKKFRVLKKKH